MNEFSLQTTWLLTSKWVPKCLIVEEEDRDFEFMNLASKSHNKTPKDFKWVS